MRKVGLFIVCFLFIPITVLATSWAYEFVVYNNNTYEVTREKVAQVGDKLGEVTAYSDMDVLSGNFSNRYKVGTAYYKIIGVDVSEAIAVEVTHETYRRAVYTSPHVVDINEMPQPVEEPNEIIHEDPEMSWYMWIVIIVVVILLVLIFIIVRRERQSKG